MHIRKGTWVLPTKVSLSLGVEGMFYCVGSLDLVLEFGIWLELGSRLVKSSPGSRDKTLGSIVGPSELLGPPGSSLLWSVSQVDTL